MLMRIIFTLFLFLFIADFLTAQDLAGKTTGLNIVTTDPAVKKDSNIRIGCCRSCRGSLQVTNDPLLVVDGQLQKMETLSSINPNDIEDIHILKNAEATAIYGHEAAAGVIIIRTKSSKVREFVIKDFLTGEEIPAASVSFIRQPLQKDTLRFVSDDSGFISTNKLTIGGEYEAVITSTGYKSLNVKFNAGHINKQMTLLLERDMKECEMVTVAATVCPRKITCSTWCGIRRHSVYKDEETIQEVVPVSPVAIFPNPVSRGQSLTIQTLSDQQNSLQAIVTDFSGKTVLQQNFSAAKGVNRFAIHTDSRWPAGVYLLHWKNEKGIVLQTQQIVVR